MSNSQLEPVPLGNKNGGHGLVQSSPVHINRSPNGNHKSRHSWIDPHVVQSLYGDGHRGGTEIDFYQLLFAPKIQILPRRRSKSGGQNLTQPCDGLERQRPRANEIDNGQRAKTVQEQAQEHRTKVQAQLAQQVGEAGNLHDLGDYQEEDPDGRQPKFF